MLVLTRKPSEEIHIGDGVTITILRVRGQCVRVGIKAPDDVRIVRAELETAGQDEAPPVAGPAERVASLAYDANDRTRPLVVGSQGRGCWPTPGLPSGRSRRARHTSLRMLAARRREAHLTQSIEQVKSFAGQ